MITKKASAYNLYSTERIFRDKSLVSYYFQPNRKIYKKFEPVNINGERYRLNKLTGDISTYKLKDIINSKSASVRRTKILMNMLLNMNDFYWFWTLTFDKERIDRTNDKAVLECYEKFINNVSKQCLTFKYMTLPERHEDGCIHFHLLVAGISPEQMGLVNSGKVCCHWATKKNGVCSREYFEKTKHLHELKETDGETIFNVTKFAYGLTTCSRICSKERCYSYVKKYVEKALGCTDTYMKRFYYSRNLNVPDVVKRLVGADFDIPTDITKLPFVVNSPYLKNALGDPYVNYNVLQLQIDNETKNFIDRGFIPVNDEEEKNAFKQAFETQLKFNV